MQPDPTKYELDPVYLNSKREAKVILGVFALFALYTVFTCYAFGLRQQAVNAEPQDFSLLFGMPSWVAWGVVLPWLLANIVTGWFCFGFMKHDALVDDSEDCVSGDGEPIEAKSTGAEFRSEEADG